ncbi:hypothetical protein ACU4GD_42325 [Cupriavidus basilensis]
MKCWPSRSLRQLNNGTDAAIRVSAAAGGIERIADVPIYHADADRAPCRCRCNWPQPASDAPDARRALSADPGSPRHGRAGGRPGARDARAGQRGLPAALEAALPAGTVRVSAGTVADGQPVAAMFGTVHRRESHRPGRRRVERGRARPRHKKSEDET